MPSVFCFICVNKTTVKMTRHQSCPTLTRVTGVTNCWRGLGKEKEGKNKNRTKVSSLHFRTEFGATGRKGEKNLQSRTRRAGGKIHIAGT